MKTKDFDLAFEDCVGESPKELWRVVSLRPWQSQEIRHINYFATEEAARKHADWINDGRGRVVSIDKYVLQ